MGWTMIAEENLKWIVKHWPKDFKKKKIERLHNNKHNSKNLHQNNNLQLNQTLVWVVKFQHTINMAEHHNLNTEINMEIIQECNRATLKCHSSNSTKDLGVDNKVHQYHSIQVVNNHSKIMEAILIHT